MSEAEKTVTVTCQNCGEEITNTRANLKSRDYECPYCGGCALTPAEE